MITTSQKKVDKRSIAAVSKFHCINSNPESQNFYNFKIGHQIWISRTFTST